MSSETPTKPGFYWRAIGLGQWRLLYLSSTGNWTYASSSRPVRVGVDGERWSDEVVAPS